LLLVDLGTGHLLDRDTINQLRLVQALDVLATAGHQYTGFVCLLPVVDVVAEQEHADAGQVLIVVLADLAYGAIIAVVRRLVIFSFDISVPLNLKF